MTTKHRVAVMMLIATPILMLGISWAGNTPPAAHSDVFVFEDHEGEIRAVKSEDVLMIRHYGGGATGRENHNNRIYLRRHGGTDDLDLRTKSYELRPGISVFLDSVERWKRARSY